MPNKDFQAQNVYLYSLFREDFVGSFDASAVSPVPESFELCPVSVSGGCGDFVKNRLNDLLDLLIVQYLK